MKSFRLLVLLAVVSVQLGAQIDLNGYVKSFAYVNTHSGEFERLGTRFQTRLSGSWNDQTGIFAAVNFEADLGTQAADSTGEHFSIFPVEFYLDYHTRMVDFRLGRQLIFWGVVDWVSPADVINPWDHSRMSGEIEDYRLPVTAASATAYWSDFQLQAVLIPTFEPVDMPLPPGTETSMPEKKLSNSQLGARLTSYLGLADISLTLFDGFEAYPEVRPDGMSLRAEYPRYQLLGCDVVRPVGAWALKGEAAYLRRADRDGTDPFKRNSQLRGMAGVDYNPTDRLSLSCQGSLDAYLNYNEDADTDSLAAMGLTGMFQPEPAVTPQASLMLNWQAGDYVAVQVMGLYNLEAEDALLLTFASWDIADGFQALLGGI
ncbi:MAG: hypothetical protein JSW54_02750, partial [Fidelibacterota bacterium]